MLVYPMSFLGRPAYEAESMDGMITGGADNYMLLLANREAFVIADRVGCRYRTDSASVLRYDDTTLGAARASTLRTVRFVTM